MTDKQPSPGEIISSPRGGESPATVDFSAWIGRERHLTDYMDPGPATRLLGLLDDTRLAHPDTPLPDGWQWLYFLPGARQSVLGQDGHEKRGRFLPPVELPRRMFAAGKATFHRSLMLARPAQLTERITSITAKQGRAGPLVFVQVVRSFRQESQLAVEEEQTIVYRSMPQPNAPAAPREHSSATAEWRREMRADPTLLFRFSALTFNAHRIHYDRDYSRQEEGYPGLVVHGPLVALLLLEEARKRSKGRRLRSFQFRALQPLFDLEPFRLCGYFDGAAASLWAEAPDGSVAMQGEAGLEL